MEHILSGEFFDAQTAEKHGLISKVVEPEETITEAIKMAEKIALFSNPIVNMAKECINQSYNLTLRDSI